MWQSDADGGQEQTFPEGEWKAFVINLERHGIKTKMEGPRDKAGINRGYLKNQPGQQ